MKIFKKIKNFFEYKGSTKGFKTLYEKFYQDFNSKDYSKLSSTINSMNELIATRGDDRLVKECIALYKSIKNEIITTKDI